MPRNPAGCEGCRFLLREDTGYSNYTVTGENVECLKNANPLMPTGDDYGLHEDIRNALAYGEECPVQEPGDFVWIDVDGEEWDRLRADPTLVDNDVRALLWQRMGWDTTDGGTHA